MDPYKKYARAVQTVWGIKEEIAEAERAADEAIRLKWSLQEALHRAEDDEREAYERWKDTLTYRTRREADASLETASA